LADGKASWCRIPTHPTLDENVEIVSCTKPHLVLAHSCEADALASIAAVIPQARIDIRSRRWIDV
jgi:hypothetical protein